METQNISTMDAFKVYAKAYRDGYRQITDKDAELSAIVERYQAVKHHQYTPKTARLIGFCHGILDA